MDPSQITGAASSYARKYALNGLFAIDDTKDADTVAPEPQKQPEQSAKVVDLTNHIKKEVARLTDDFKDTDSLVDIYKTLGVENFNQILNATPQTKEMILNQLEDMK
jgi:hypothetical protein